MQAALAHYGKLHLTLGRVSISRDGFLDFRGGQLTDFDASHLTCQEHHAARVTHEDRRARVFVVRVELLNRHVLWLQLIKQRTQIIMKLCEAKRHGCSRLQPQHARFHKSRLCIAISKINTTVAGQLQTGINAQNTQNGVHSLKGVRLDLAVAQAHDALAAFSHTFIVRDHDDRHAGCMQVIDECKNCLTCF